MEAKVGIIMGSDSDLKVMKEAAEMLEHFGIKYELTIVSAHRTPKRLYEYAIKAKENGFDVIIAGAGGSAHLPGMVASITSLPVIGVPIKTATLKGVDSLHSIVQMPPGIPVATMAINGAKNAGILAAKIIGVFDNEICKKVVKYKEELEMMVQTKAEKLEEVGFKEYLNTM
ncbi:MAG: 5-(carboxyamino)imidazole ribonucleotide mutase [Oscillospiraceae bacterium]|nr:5-(carboxyamino)imidazole ribonucleotide mutase [Oscillospiraceae bacterium]